MDLGLGIANRGITAQFSSKVRDRNALYKTSLDRFGQSVTLCEERKEGRWQKMEEKILQNSKKRGGNSRFTEVIYRGNRGGAGMAEGKADAKCESK